MKYKLIYTFSFLILFYVWVFPIYDVDKTENYEQIDSTSIAESSPKLESTPPTIIYIERESDKGMLGISNEFVTLMIGIGNIITMYYQFKKK